MQCHILLSDAQREILLRLVAERADAQRAAARAERALSDALALVTGQSGPESVYRWNLAAGEVWVEGGDTPSPAPTTESGEGA